MARKKKVVAVEETVDVVEEVVEETVEIESVEEDAIIPEEEVTEEPINTPETAVEVEEPQSEKDAVVKRIKVNAAAFSKEYFEDRKAKGCDYSQFGEWQKLYGKLINHIFSIKNMVIADIGGAYGAISKALLDNGAKRVVCTDISKHAVELKQFPKVEYVHAPVQHMKAIADETFDLVHISHVMEHVNPMDIERSMKEIGRVMKHSALCFIVGQCDIEQLKEFGTKHIGEIVDGVDFFKNAPKELEAFNEYNWKIVLFSKK